jgi:hypothetical protein
MRDAVAGRVNGSAIWETVNQKRIRAIKAEQAHEPEGL